MSLLYHSKSFTIPSGGTLWLLGGIPPAYRPASSLSKVAKLVLFSKKSVASTVASDVYKEKKLN